jgi:hypothetical protein
MITILAYLTGTVLGYYFGKFHERAVWNDAVSELTHEERAIILSKALEQLLLEIGDYHRQTDEYEQILEDYGYEAVHAN